ncbi:MAG TPA: hypothetical protein VK426_05250 [Methanobacterium sp.]|nr:hypothetical protein [Methanobacterium sp.]
MIENKIKTLRQAAKVSTVQDSDKIWCVIAGNEEMVNNVAYEAILNKDRVKILFREHITSRESFVTKKYDFIMLYGETSKIRDLSLISKESGGAYLKIAPYYVEDESNLMLVVGPEDNIKKFLGDVEKSTINASFLLEDKTTGFIESDVYIIQWMPNFVRNVADPLFKMADVALSTVLMSTDEENIEKIKKIAKTNKIFAIRFKDILKEE